MIPSFDNHIPIRRSIDVLTYISEAAIGLCGVSKERLRSVRSAMEGTDRALARINRETHTG